MRPGAVHWQKLWSIVAALPMLLNGCGTNKTVLEEIVEQVYPIALNTDLSIHNRDGAVLVYGSDGNELRVRSAKKAYSRARSRLMSPQHRAPFQSPRNFLPNQSGRSRIIQARWIAPLLCRQQPALPRST